LERPSWDSHRIVGGKWKVAVGAVDQGCEFPHADENVDLINSSQILMFIIEKRQEIIETDGKDKSNVLGDVDENPESSVPSKEVLAKFADYRKSVMQKQTLLIAQTQRYRALPMNKLKLLGIQK
jgi:hypothetical protein